MGQRARVHRLIARACGGEIDEEGGRFQTERKSLLEVAQSISVIVSLAERGDERDVLTLSTLHAAKGLEWPHVILAGVNEGCCPGGRRGRRRRGADAERLQEERR